jgi:hypothetical protein
METDDQSGFTLNDWLEIIRAIQSAVPGLDLNPVALEREGERAVVLLPYLKSNPGKKVYRLNGISVKSKIFDDPYLRDRFFYTAGVLGISFDELIGNSVDTFIEYALNERPESYGTIIEEMMKNARLKEATIFRYEGNDRRIFHRIYRFKEKYVVQSSDAQTKHYRKGGNALDLRVRLPLKAHQALFSKITRGNVFREFSPRQFVESLFNQLLKENSIPNQLRLSTFHIDDLAEAIQEPLSVIHRLEKWEPHGWLTPPTLHPTSDLDNKSITYSFLTEQNHPSLLGSSGFEVERIEIPYPYINKEDIFHPVRDFLPYIEKRFWRNSNSFFGLLILQFLKANELYDFAFDVVPDDFQDRFISAARNIRK